MRFEYLRFRISEISLREAKLNSQFNLRLRKFNSQSEFSCGVAAFRALKNRDIRQGVPINKSQGLIS